MKILKKLVIKDLKLNKKRTIGTLVGIILSCALIMVVGGMFFTGQNSLMQSEINNGGYWHIRLRNVDEKTVDEIKTTRLFSDVTSIYNVGYTYYEKEYNFTGDIYSMDKKTFDKLGYSLLQGEFPKDENEILINRYFQSIYSLKVGDYFDLEVGDLENDDIYSNQDLQNSTTRKVKIVGIVNRYNDIITTNLKSDKYISYLALENPSDYKEDISSFLGVSDYKSEHSKKYKSYEVNENLLRWEVFDFSDDVLRVLTTMVGIIIFVILVTSIFSIRNSFAISITEKLKMFGMVSSVGATKKQIRKMVLYEGLVLGLVGVTSGVLLGLLVTVSLTWIINTIAESASLFGEGMSLVYKFSFIPIIISVVLSFLIIYLSLLSSAFRASRVSPLNNIRNSDNLKSKKLKTPKLIKKIFGIGGVLSYKNLKRSKKKYRVTIISLTVSIFIFIVVSTFIEYTLDIVHTELVETNYNVAVYIEGTPEQEKDGIKNLNELIDKVSKLETPYIEYRISYDDNSFSPELKCDSHILDKDNCYGDDKFNINFMLYNDAAFKEYAERIGLNYKDVKDTVILVNEVEDYSSDKKNATIKLTNYKKGDPITLYNYLYGNEENSIEKYEFTVGGVTKELPIGGYDTNVLTVVGREGYFEELGVDAIPLTLYFDSDEPYDLVTNIKELSDENKTTIYIENIEEQASQMRSMLLIVSIIVYGFIIVVTLIGVSSVFNTINSNMLLRSKDFATLKSVGMTKKEFNNMINLEAIFYSFKSLVYGLVLGLIGSRVIFELFTDDYEFPYKLPTTSIFVCIIFIVIIVLMIMKYSIGKIRKQNIIETIRNNNI